MENQKPSIGRIVHFKDNKADAVCIAAIITEINDDSVVKLTLFTPMTNSHFAIVGFEADPNPLHTMVGSWHWPERV